MGVIIRNGIEYSGGGGSSATYLTQAEYDALPESKLTDGVEYRITDANTSTTAARNIAYDNSESGIEATSVQGAIDAVNNRLSEEYVLLASTTSTTATNSVTVDDLNNYRRLSLYVGTKTTLNESAFINGVEIPMGLFKGSSMGMQSRYTDSNYASCTYISDTSVKLYTKASGQMAVLYGIR